MRVLQQNLVMVGPVPGPLPSRNARMGTHSNLGEVRVQPHLLDLDRAVTVQVELPVSAVGTPAGGGQECAAYVVAGVEPHQRSREPVRAQRVGAGLDQPGAVSVPGLFGVDGQLAYLAVDDRVRVGVRGRPGDREAAYGVA